MTVLEIESFLYEAKGPIIDVRSPCEFSHAHIPGSLFLPLFTDEERAHVGTVYKQSGHDAAVLIGLKAVGPKLATLAKEIRKGLGDASCCRVTCFRGGMRSRSIAWLCDFLGFQTVRLDGGYKAYRQHVLSSFSRQYSFIILGGPTGSGKTNLLHELATNGVQTVDLEGLANHRGSAFGLLPGVVQPSTEQFENLLSEQLCSLDPNKPIVIEDESRMVGSCAIPKGIYEQMDLSPLIWLEEPFESRLARSIEAYGSLPKEWLQECTQKLMKRLGRERVSTVISAIDSGDLQEAASILLQYYDDAYSHSLLRHNRPVTHMSAQEALSRLLGSSQISLKSF